MPEGIEIVPADRGDAGLQQLVGDHLADMVAATPDPRSRHALDHDAMFGAGVSVWAARLDGRTVGCGALHELSPAAGELKAMRTAGAVRGRGVGTAVLRHLLAECRGRGYDAAYLETGAQDFFAPARRLYAAHGFVEVGPFAAYVADPASIFMRLDLVSPTRAAVLSALAEHLGARDPGHPLRVRVDGICGVGKTTFADDLAVALRRVGRPVVVVDSDGFHHVRARRHRRGRGSARGYYDDAYDLDAVASRVLAPLGPGGSREYAVRVHDLATDEVITDETATAPADAVVLFAATFLQRGPLRERWDEVIWLDAAEAVATARGVTRDAAAMGGERAAAAAYESRYAAACRLYLAEEHPRARASIVVAHGDPLLPRVVRTREDRGGVDATRRRADADDA